MPPISIAHLQVYYTQRRSRQSTDTFSEFHAEAPQTTVSEELSQGPYVAARASVEPTTLRTKDVDSTHAPPKPHVELCADVIVPAAARRSISVGGGGPPPVQKTRRRRRRGAARRGRPKTVFSRSEERR